MTLYWCTSSGPNRVPVAQEIAPDATWHVQPGLVRLATWPSGWRQMTAYVEAQSRDDAEATAAVLFAQAWREVG